jgi:hypothetical protein
MRVLAIDPGNVESAFVIYEAGKIEREVLKEIALKRIERNG